MKLRWLMGFLGGVCMMAAGTGPGWADPPACGMQADRDFVILMEGVTGGVAPAMPTLRMVILRRTNGEAAIYRADAPTGGHPTFKEGAVPDYDAFEKQLVDLGLGALPHEKEPGFSDLYGKKTALHWHRDGACWYTQPPNGCIIGAPEMQVTDQQKAAFARAVEAVEARGAAAAKESSQERLGKAFQTLSAPPPPAR